MQSTQYKEKKLLYLAKPEIQEYYKEYDKLYKKRPYVKIKAQKIRDTLEFKEKSKLYNAGYNAMRRAVKELNWILNYYKNNRLIESHLVPFNIRISSKQLDYSQTGFFSYRSQ